jgi:protein-disulfide isomerase
MADQIADDTRSESVPDPVDGKKKCGMSSWKCRCFVVGLSFILSLVALGVSLFVLNSGGSSMKDRDDLEKTIRNYILSNPEILFEAAQNHEMSRRQEAEKFDQQNITKNQDEIFNDGYSFVHEGENSDVTIVEFTDYQCPYCKKVHNEVLSFLEDDKKVRFIVKEFPVLGPNSVIAAKVALAVKDVSPKKYKLVSNDFVEYKGRLDENAIQDIVTQNGLDWPDILEASNSKDVLSRIEKNRDLARELGIRGTPAFVFDHKIVRGFIPADMLKTFADEARQSKRK